MILEAVAALGVWTWWIVGLVLLAVELAAPGSILLWLGVSALAVGVLSLALPWGWQAQILAFAALSVASVALSRRHLARREQPPVLNRGAHRFLGQTFVLREPIAAGVGHLQIDDTLWRIAGPDLAAGESVRVSGLDGPLLLVEPASARGARAGET